MKNVFCITTESSDPKVILANIGLALPCEIDEEKWVYNGKGIWHNYEEGIICAETKATLLEHTLEYFEDVCKGIRECIQEEQEQESNVKKDI